MQWKPEDVVWAVPEKGLYLCVAGYFQMRLDVQERRPTCQYGLLLKGMGLFGTSGTEWSGQCSRFHLR